MTISGTMVPIGELSRLTGCNIETIRYYERIGILPVPFRRGRYRAYDSADVRRLSFVRRARELGFPIDAVRALLALADGGPASCSQARELADTHLGDVRAKIADLRRMEQVLSDTVSACNADDNALCPLLETLWTAGVRSPSVKSGPGRKPDDE
jgi:MerR family mercuric resistance operon transcriptional regulator